MHFSMEVPQDEVPIEFLETVSQMNDYVIEKMLRYMTDYDWQLLAEPFASGFLDITRNANA
jgi:hypothetical protein